MDIISWIELMLLGNTTPAHCNKTEEEIRADGMAWLYEGQPAILNTGRIVDIGIPEVKKFEFRPQTWEQYIGQDDAKERVKTIVAQFKRGMKAHVFLSAIPGSGKTSFAELLAKTLNAHLIQRIGSVMTTDSLIEVINEINGTQMPCVFFLDEAETCNKKIFKILNSVVESYQISGQKIRPFLMICASINKNVLLKTNPDFLQRLQNHIYLARYTIDELTKIISKVYEELYSEENISPQNLRLLAENCKYCPRIGINLLEAFVVDHNIDHVLKTWGIVKDGLNLTDVKILEYLASQSKPVGACAIAMKCCMSQREYESEWEPFLFEFGYLDRRPSRVITSKGREFLSDLPRK